MFRCQPLSDSLIKFLFICWELVFQSIHWSESARLMEALAYAKLDLNSDKC